MADNKMIAVETAYRDEVKEVAVREHKTMQAYVQAALRKAFAESRQRLRRRKMREGAI